jgi:hypothetical protein
VSVAARDDVDLRIALSELAAGREMLADAHAMLDRRDRFEATKVAIARLALAARAIDEVVDRGTPKTKPKPLTTNSDSEEHHNERPNWRGSRNP